MGGRVCVRPLYEYRMAGQGIGPRAHCFRFLPQQRQQSCVLVRGDMVDVCGAPIPNHIYIYQSY